jgi:flavin-dependent dehydrogenase
MKELFYTAKNYLYAHKDHRKTTKSQDDYSTSLKLTQGARVGVIGGGPAGSLFSYFLLDMAQRIDLNLQVDLYEQKDFSNPGPAGCNMCGGVISESLVQTLATEGINLPPSVVQRGIDSSVVHMDAGTVRIRTPVDEKRIASVHRGVGPRGLKEIKWASFDGYLLKLAKEKGVNVIMERVIEVDWENNLPKVKTRNTESPTYELLGVAVGVNSTTLDLFEKLIGVNYELPRVIKTYISDFFVGQAKVQEHFGNAMHVFLLDIPRLEFGAIIPKGEYVTVCLLGEHTDTKVAQLFLSHPQVKQCFPDDWDIPEMFCHCSPRMNIGSAPVPFSNRMVFLGDCGVSRLYKDGIGAAYRTAKAAATTVIFEGVATRDFRQHYLSTCQDISRDNRIGKIIFSFTGLVKKSQFIANGILRMTTGEQQRNVVQQSMSSILWDLFTGSASYRSISLRALHPLLMGKLFWNIIAGSFKPVGNHPIGEEVLSGKSDLGKTYQDGEIIVHEGEAGTCMYVIQEGYVEVFLNKDGQELHLVVLKEGDFFGEIPLIEREKRHASVRALGIVRVLTVDRKTLHSSIQKDPSLAYRILQTMARRISVLSDEIVKLRSHK